MNKLLKLYIFIVAIILVSITVVGFVLPQMISAKDSLVNILGVLVGVIYTPALYFSVTKIMKWSKNEE